MKIQALPRIDVTLQFQEEEKIMPPQQKQLTYSSDQITNPETTKY